MAHAALWKEPHATVPPYSTGNYEDGARPARSVDAGRLWTGGLATAFVAALVTLVGVMIARGCSTCRCSPHRRGHPRQRQHSGWPSSRPWLPCWPPGCCTCCC